MHNLTVRCLKQQEKDAGGWRRKTGKTHPLSLSLSLSVHFFLLLHFLIHSLLNLFNHQISSLIHSTFFPLTFERQKVLGVKTHSQVFHLFSHRHPLLNITKTQTHTHRHIFNCTTCIFYSLSLSTLGDI